MQRLSVDELLGRLALPGGIDSLAEDPVVVVEGDGDAPNMADRLAGVPAMVVAVGRPADDPVAAAADTIVVDDHEVARVALAVAAHQTAAVALAVLLRGGGARTIREALVAESATYSVLQSGPDHGGWLARQEAPPRRQEEGGPVVVRRDGDRLHIMLDRPEVHNAYSAAMRDALVDALAIAAADPAVDVVIDGAGRSFCSGGDLAEFGALPDPATAHLVRLRRSAGRAIAEVADRVTVRVHGACIGAGVELAAFAGRVVAHPDTIFRLPEVTMGLVPGAGGTVSLPRRIGRQRALWLAITAEPIDAPTALAWGLVDAVDPAIP